MDQIWIIEDKSNLRVEKAEAIQQFIAQRDLSATLQVVEADDSLLNELTNISDDKHEYLSIEDKVALYLIDHRDIKLIVVDRDLTSYNSEVRSESTISEGGALAALPVCGYSRRIRRQNVGAALEKIGLDINQSLIEVSKEPRELAASVVETYIGFQEVQQWVEANPNTSNEKESRRLAMMLKEENQAPYFDGYSNTLPLMLHWLQAKEEGYKNIFDSYRVGQLLRKFVLPFPGILVNSEHLAVYLNLDQSDFEKHSNYFDSCLYVGPFSNFSDYWWRYKVDDLLMESGSIKGSDFIVQSGGPQLADLDRDGAEQVFCMISKRVIPWSESIPLKMAPAGADLSRIDRSEAEQWQMYLP